MSTPANDYPSSDPTPRPARRDLSFAVTACLFIFMGMDTLIDHQWIASAGWLAMSLGLFVLVASKPMTGENWNRPRYLVCLALLAAGVSLLLFAPNHHPRRTPTLSRPAASLVPTPANP